MRSLVERIEPALSHARASLSTGSAPQAHAAVSAARSFLTLYATPDYLHYDPRALIERHCRPCAVPNVEFILEDTPNCIGDPAQVTACATCLIESAELAHDTTLIVELAACGEIPCAELTLDGPGAFPDEVRIGGHIRALFAEISERWTVATRGGRIDRTPKGLSLRLSGQREPAKPLSGLNAWLEPVRQAEQALRLHIAGESPDLRAAVVALDLVLARLDDEGRSHEPADLASVIAQALERVSPGLHTKHLSLEVYTDPAVPPFPMHRTRMAGFFAGMLEFAAECLPRGGSLTLLSDYDTAHQEVNVMATITGAQCALRDAPWLASMRRAAEEIHHGTLDVLLDGQGITVSARFPDTIGRTLAQWIPGFHLFSPQTVKILRLLKSGGQAPPPDALLPAILEHELERWLLPSLSSPLAANIANEVLSANPKPPPRLAKPLNQIARGKPKKEICAPASAAAILRAYARDDRSKKALGMERLDQDRAEALCLALEATPSDCVQALRGIARVIEQRKDSGNA